MANYSIFGGRVKAFLLRIGGRREPDFIIGGSDRPYLKRWWLIPRNRFLNIYLHQFLRSDDDRALHDHPWAFNASWLLDGEYIEHTTCEHGCHRLTARRKAGDWKFRWGRAPHRVELLPEVIEVKANSQRTTIREFPCWTVFITGPRIREWGFYCDKGWIHWKRFTAANDPGAVGKGCDA